MTQQLPPNRDQVIADIRAATTKEFLASVYQYAAAQFANDPATVQMIAQECSNRDAYLTQQLNLFAGPAPAQMPPPPLPPPPGAGVRSPEPPDNVPGSYGRPPRQAMPHEFPPEPPRPDLRARGESFDTARPAPSPSSPLGKPPGWLGDTSFGGLGTVNATGLGGVPALDVLRCELVNLAAAAWDCGCDLSQIVQLRDVSAATPDKLWSIASQATDTIREYMHRPKQPGAR